MNKIKKIACTLVLVWIGIGFFMTSINAEETSLPELYKLVAPSVIQLHVYYNDPDSGATGTGFFVAPRQILTNAHVVEKAAFIFVWDEDESDLENYDVLKVLKLDEVNDLALLEIDGLIKPWLKFAEEEPYIGQEIYALGFPKYLDKTLSEGIVGSKDRYSPSFLFSAPVSSGNSGSPVLNKAGHVVGIFSSYLEDGQNLNIATDSSAIKEFLNQPNDPKEFPLVPYVEEEGAVILFRSAKSFLSNGVNFIFGVGEWVFFTAIRAASLIIFLLLAIIFVKNAVRLCRLCLSKTVFPVFVLFVVISGFFLSVLYFLLLNDSAFQHRPDLFIIATMLGVLFYLINKNIVRRLVLNIHALQKCETAVRQGI